MSKRFRRLRVEGAAFVALAALWVGSANAATLTWDSGGHTPTGPIDGSGTWDDSTVRWSTGGADQAWIDGSKAVIGHGNGHAAYTITLAANVSAASLTFLNAGTGSYTISGNASGNFSGYTLASTGAWNVSNAIVTLTGGTFVDGLPASSTVITPRITSGGSLTLATGAIFQTAGIFGDSTGSTPNNSNVFFNGGTLQPVLPTGAVAPLIFETGHAQLSTGGLVVDTSLSSGSFPQVIDPLAHSPAGNSVDGGLTLNGGGSLVLGADESFFDPVFTYNGPTIVNNGTLILDTGAHTASITGTLGSGPFPSTSFTVNSHGVLKVVVSDALIGETGTGTVTLNGGTLYAVTNGTTANQPTSCYIGNTTLAGGTIKSDAGSSFEWLANTELHATASAALSAAQIAFEPGSDIRIDPGAVLATTSSIVDSSPPGVASQAGQLTLNGAGTMQLLGKNTFSGNTIVNAGSLVLESTGSLTRSPVITVAAGASFTDAGLLGSTPAVTVNGNATFGPNFNSGIGVVTLASLTLGESANTANGVVTLVQAASHANRLLLITGSLVLSGTTNAWTSKLDLSNNDLNVQQGNLATITNQLKTGYNAGHWNSSVGIISNAAANLTALGVITNSTNGTTPLYGVGDALGPYDGTSPAATDVLVKFTYYGDANLSGKVDGTDYAAIDNGYAQHLTGWWSGDFNYDGVVNGSDYTLIDNTFNTQGASLAAAVSATVDVPEPAECGLAALISSAILLGRRRRRESTVNLQMSLNAHGCLHPLAFS